MQNYYLNTGTTSTITIVGFANYDSPSISVQVQKTEGIHPILYFKYIKSKFRLIEKLTLERRLKKLEKAFEKAVENGQDALARKVLNEVVRETRESVIYAKGIRHFIEREDLMKHRHRLRGGKIADTKIKEYTRLIPKNILEKKKKVEMAFDDFVIFHYFDEDQVDVKTMSREEKEKMKDPVLFGIINETDRLYFIGDWEDDYCDLTFDEMLGVLGKDEDEVAIGKNPRLDFERGE